MTIENRSAEPIETVSEDYRHELDKMEKIKGGKVKQEQWTKKCKCGSYIPDEYESCSNCLLEKYELITEGEYHIDAGEE